MPSKLPKALNYYLFSVPQSDIDMELAPGERQLVHQYIAKEIAPIFCESRFRHIRRHFGKKINYDGSEMGERFYTGVTMALGSILYSGIAQMMGFLIPDSMEAIGIIGIALGITWLSKKSLTRLLAIREVHIRTAVVENDLLAQLHNGANEFLQHFVGTQLQILRRVEKKPPILQDYVVVPAMVCEVLAVLYQILIDADDLIVAVLCAAIPNLIMLVAANLLSVKFEIPRLYYEILKEYNSRRTSAEHHLPLEDEDDEDDNSLGGAPYRSSPPSPDGDSGEAINF